ncbi:MAG: hypothetical protein Q9208_008664 [Pyrenodesmia sp. 3 TL-2023]
MDNKSGTSPTVTIRSTDIKGQAKVGRGIYDERATAATGPGWSTPKSRYSRGPSATATFQRCIYTSQMLPILPAWAYPENVHERASTEREAGQVGSPRSIPPLCRHLAFDDENTQIREINQCKQCK